MKCSDCRNGFYLKDHQCLKSQEIENCLEYDDASTQKCLKCAPNSIRVEMQSCQSIVSPIKNCLQYSSYFSCSQCQEGYALPDCAPILFPENCLVKQASANICQKCNSLAFMFNDNCYYKQDLGLETCANNGLNLRQTQPFTCSFCENTSELMSIPAFTTSCVLEKFQDFFSGKCISIKKNVDGRGALTTRQARVHSVQIRVLLVGNGQRGQLREDGLRGRVRPVEQLECDRPTGPGPEHLAGGQDQGQRLFVRGRDSQPSRRLLPLRAPPPTRAFGLRLPEHVLPLSLLRLHRPFPVRLASERYF